VTDWREAQIALLISRGHGPAKMSEGVRHIPICPQIPRPEMQTVAMRFLSRRRVAFSLLATVLVALLFLVKSVLLWTPVERTVSTMGVVALHYTPDGKEILCATGTDEMKMLSVSSLETLSSYGKDNGWLRAQFSENGLLIGETYRREVCLMEGQSGHIIWKREIDSSSSHQAWQGSDVEKLAISPKGESVIYITSWFKGGSAFSLRVRGQHVSAQPEEEIKPKGGFSADPSQVQMAFSQDGTFVYSIEGEGIFFLNNGKSIPLPMESPYNKIQAPALMFSPDSRTLAANCPGYGIVLWDFSKKRVSRILPIFSPGSCSCLAFSHDGKTLAVAEQGDIITLWNISSGQKLSQIRTNEDIVLTMCFSPDDSHIAIGTSGGQVQLWRLQ